MKRPHPLLVLPTVLAAVAVGLVVWLRGPGGSRDDVELVDSREALEELLAERAGTGPSEVATPGAPPALVREPLTEEQAAAFFPGLRQGGRDVFDPVTYYRQKPDLDLKRRLKEHPLGKWRVTTNAQGFRNARDLLPEKPDLRVLVTGDSHVDGVVPMEELATTVLERLLVEDEPDRGVEVLNAARGGYSFFNYLGVIEKYAALDPDVFVVVFYGGNDFAESLPLYKYFRHLPLDPGLEGWGRLLGEALEISNAGVAQCVHQEAHFARVPADFDLALEGGRIAGADRMRGCVAEQREGGVFQAFALAQQPGQLETVQVLRQVVQRQGELDEMLEVALISVFLPARLE